MDNITKYLDYNSILILSYFFLSLIFLFINFVSKGKFNKTFVETRRSSLLNPLTYLRLITHSIGHKNFAHLSSNFLIILLVGPLIEEKYGTMNLLIMMLITSCLIGILNSLISKNAIIGSSGIVYMLITLSSFVNLNAHKIPLTSILIFIFYIAREIKDGLFKKDNISHFSHLLGAICGIVFGLYFK